MRVGREGRKGEGSWARKTCIMLTAEVFGGGTISTITLSLILYIPHIRYYSTVKLWECDRFNRVNAVMACENIPFNKQQREYAVMVQSPTEEQSTFHT